MKRIGTTMGYTKPIWQELLLIFLPTTVSTPMYDIAAPSSPYCRIDTFTYLAVWIVGNGILSSSALQP